MGEQSSLSAETVALHKYVFRRPAVEVTEENAYVLQLLDCLTRKCMVKWCQMGNLQIE